MAVDSTDRVAAVAEWIAREGRLLPRLEAFVVGLMERACGAGIPVWRFYIGLELMHPQLQALGVVWRRDRPVEAELIERKRGIEFTGAYIGSPVQEIRETGHEVRHRLDALAPAAHAVLHEVRDAGGTDYFGVPLRMARGGRAPVATFSTDCPGGFTDADLADLRRLIDHAGAVVEMHVHRIVADTVVATYIGHHTGQRILDGLVRRGDGDRINAVLWFSDLRDFTGLNERASAGEVLELLNAYFEAVGGALKRHGGEILKFIGDGVMAYFPAEDALFMPMVTAAALDAARQLIADAEAANEARATGGAEPIKFGIGLHVGTVTFGNIGTEDRLDFTVIGSAVNRASRLEGLTKALGVPVCASAEFNADCPRPMKSLGKHRLRGVREPVEIFTLPD